MQVDSNIWGDSSTWVKDIFFWSTNATFTDNTLAWYNANPRKITDNTNFSLNNPIDYTICYAAHAANEKMPLADIEVYDYQGNKVLEQKETSGFFFCDYPNVSADYNDIWAWNAIKNNITADLQKSGIYRWLPYAYAEYIGNLNCSGQTRPVVQFGIKSLFGAIRVALIKNDYSASVYLWLKELEDNIDTYKDNYHIEEAYIVLYTYNGKTGDNFNPFTQNTRYKFNNVGGGGIAINKNLKIVGSDKELCNYDMFVSNGYLPVFGTGLNNITNYRNLGHYGIQISKRASLYYEYYDRSFSICMASAADLGVSVYETTNEYGFPAYLLNPKMSITTENCEKLRKGAAAYGLFFTDQDPTPLLTDTTNINRWTDEKMYCGVLDDDGVGHGEYTKGTGNLTNAVYSRETSQDSPYDPSAYIDPNIYSNITGFNSLTSGATMTKRYVLDAANVAKLGDDLWTICGSLSSQDFEYFDGKLKDEFLTTNPIDSVISLQRFPFEIPHTGSTKAPIKLGKSTVTAEGYSTVNPLNTIVFTGKDIFPRFGNCFLDYEPFTSYEVYVPFCGTIKIRAADILGHTLNVLMQIDLFTGSCTAYIMADQLVIETMNGSCGVDQTVSGTQTATINANIYNGILNQQLAKKQMAFQTANALMPSNWINPIGYAAKGEQTETAYKEATYAIEHVETPPHSIGSASPLLSWCQEFDARIIIYYPEGDVIQSSTPPSFNKSALQAFGHTKGFGTVTPGTVSSFHGYTQGTIIADNIPCTESERNRIKEAFASGVFLP